MTFPHRSLHTLKRSQPTPIHTMRHSSLIATGLFAMALLTGCATTSSDKPAAAPAEVATPATPPVKVPVAASRHVVLFMTGPQHVVQAKDWPVFKQEWQDTFAGHAKAAGMRFGFAETGAQIPQGQNGTLLHVTVADYRMVGIGARIFFGAMTGNAYIDAKVTFSDLRGGSTFGHQQHNTTSSAWSGVFAKVTPQQVDAIATVVFNDIKAAQ